MDNKRLHFYLHEYDFPYHNYLLENLTYIDKIYEEGKVDALGNELANVRLYHKDMWNFLNSKLIKIVTENYYVSPPFVDHEIGIYKQQNNSHIYPSHNHYHSSTMIGIVYINPPKPQEGGELILHPNPAYKDVIKIIPKPNKLYLFPGWVFHHVSPQISSIPRYSLNWGYYSRMRPIHKLTSDQW